VQQLFSVASHARMGSCMLNDWTDVILYLLYVHFLCQTRGAKGRVMDIVYKLHQIRNVWCCMRCVLFMVVFIE
jgi:hypothetical protein